MVQRLASLLLLCLLVLVIGCTNKKEATQGDPLPASEEQDVKGKKLKVFKDTIPPLPGTGGK